MKASATDMTPPRSPRSSPRGTSSSVLTRSSRGSSSKLDPTDITTLFPEGHHIMPHESHETSITKLGSINGSVVEEPLPPLKVRPRVSLKPISLAVSDNKSFSSTEPFNKLSKSPDHSKRAEHRKTKESDDGLSMFPSTPVSRESSPRLEVDRNMFAVASPSPRARSPRAVLKPLNPASPKFDIRSDPFGKSDAELIRSPKGHARRPSTSSGTSGLAGMRELYHSHLDHDNVSQVSMSEGPETDGYFLTGGMDPSIREGKVKGFVELFDRSRLLHHQLKTLRKQEGQLKVSIVTKRAESRDELPLDWLRVNHRDVYLERAAARLHDAINIVAHRMMRSKLFTWKKWTAEAQWVELKAYLKNKAALKTCYFLDNGEEQRKIIRMRNFFVMWRGKLLKTKRIEHRKAAREIQRLIRGYLARKLALQMRKEWLRRCISTLLLQRVIRGHFGRRMAERRRQYLLEMKSASLIQGVWRRFMYARKIQSFYRCQTKRRRYDKWHRGWVRCQALFRGYATRLYYFSVATKLQKIWRGYATRKWFHRHKMAMEIQKIFRGFSLRRFYLWRRQGVVWFQKQWRMISRRKWYRIAIVDHREMLKRRAWLRIQERLARKAATLLGEARKIEGITVAFKVFRNSKEAITILAYTPATCVLQTFVLVESEMRKIAEDFAAREIPTTELFSKKHVKPILDKFIWKGEEGKNRRLVMTDKIRGERGTRICRFARKLKDGNGIAEAKYTIITVYEEFGSFVFSGYDQGTSMYRLRAEATAKEIRRWLGYHPSMLHKPALLRPENHDKLLQYLIDSVELCSNCGMKSHVFLHKRQGNVLCLYPQKREERMAIRIQGMYRKRKARKAIHILIKKIYAKRFDPSSGYYYYINTLSNEVRWTKPVNMHTGDIDVKQGWEKMVNPTDKSIYYFHAATGRSTWFSEEAAAILVQKAFRKSRSKDFAVKNIGELVRAIMFQRDTEEQYMKRKDNLTSVLNMALLLHTVRNDLTEAGKLYIRAVEMASHNPIILYAYGMWLLNTSSGPMREKLWNEAQEMILSASILDSKKKMFELACQSFFHWGIVVAPSSASSLLNWALLQQCYKSDFMQAERFYKKARFADPEDIRVVQNYADFLREREDVKGLYYDGKTSMFSETSKEMYTTLKLLESKRDRASRTSLVKAL